MKKAIRLLSVMLCMVIVFPLVGTIAVSASNYTVGNYKGQFEYIITNKEVTITNINKSLKSLNIPSKIDGYPVTTIGAGACKNGKLQELTLPNTLVTIGDNAFEANYLNDIDIPSSVKYICSYAFYHGYHYSCPESFTLREGLEYIGDHAFGELFWDVNSITIPSTVYYIGEMAFWDSKLDAIYFMPMSAYMASDAINRKTTIYGYDNSSVSTDAVINSWKYQSMGTFTGIHRIDDIVFGYKNSKLVTGKNTFDGKLYWFNKNGQAYKGLTKMSNGDLYYFSKKTNSLGQAMTGWVKIGDKKYYFRTSGDNKYKAVKGWIKLKGEQYYFYSDGTMATGKVKISGKTYSFDKNGKLK